MLLAVGNGSKRAVQAGIDALGSNVLLVSAQSGPGGPGFFRRGGGGGGLTLTQADAKALEDRFDAPDVKSASPVVTATGATLVAGSVSYSPGSLVGTTPSYEAAHSYAAASGRLLTRADVTGHARSVVLGPTVVANLFAGRARSAGPCGSTGRPSPSSASPRPRAPTGSPTRTTWSWPRSPRCRTRSAAIIL